MIGKLLPVFLAVMGAGAGVGTGLFLQPEPKDEMLAANPCGESQHPDMTAHGATGEHGKSDGGGDDDAHKAEHEYVKLNNQFVVPVVATDRVESLVVLSLSVEVGAGRRDEVFSREPKLRDAFLQVLFDHANMGGFRGAFTNSNNMDVLRRALRETAKKVAGDLVTDVLIVDINRQDV